VFIYFSITNLLRQNAICDEKLMKATLEAVISCNLIETQAMNEFLAKGATIIFLVLSVKSNLVKWLFNKKSDFDRKK
jgi:hypothetical protein